MEERESEGRGRSKQKFKQLSESYILMRDAKKEEAGAEGDEINGDGMIE